jgi:hypothetical protein
MSAMLTNDSSDVPGAVTRVGVFDGLVVDTFSNLMVDIERNTRVGVTTDTRIARSNWNGNKLDGSPFSPQLDKMQLL